jgi:hypothetical protein
VIPSGEKMVTRRSLRNPTTIKMKKKLWLFFSSTSSA